MKEKRKIDLKVMFEQGCAFLDCAEFAETEQSGIEHTNSHFYANMALSALSCEIFIKLLIIKNGGIYKDDHKLNALWKKLKCLNETEAMSIEEKVQNNWFASSEKYTFERMLDNASKAFVQWRYIFDYDRDDNIKINPQFLRGFRIALKQACCQAICCDY